MYHQLAMQGLLCTMLLKEVLRTLLSYFFHTVVCFYFHSTAWSVWFLGYICCFLYLNMTLLNVWQQTHLFLMMIAKHHLRSLESKGSVMLFVQLRYVFWYPPSLIIRKMCSVLGSGFCRVTSACSLVGCVNFTDLPFLIYLLLSFFQEECECIH